MKSSKVLIICCAVFLTACGYTPVHQVKSNGSSRNNASLAQYVAVGDVVSDGINRQTQVSQMVKNELLDRLGARGSYDYIIDVSITRLLADLTLQQDTAVTRKSLRLNGSVKLRSRENGKVVFDSKVSSNASFNTPRDPYVELVAEQDAERRAARLLAENIITHASIFISRTRQISNDQTK